MPVYKHQRGLAYLFYCAYYEQSDWRISQSLPNENCRAPARIRAAADDLCSPLNPTLFWETVDDTDHWARDAGNRGIRVSWEFEDSELEPVCQIILNFLGLNKSDCTGWLACESCIKSVEAASMLLQFREFLLDQHLVYNNHMKLTEKRAYPEYINLSLRVQDIPPTVVLLMGSYYKTDFKLYNVPVYKQESGEGWLFYCEKYDNHDWRISPQLPIEGDRAPARIRSYSKYPCSPVEPGLFWEGVNYLNRWNTMVDAVEVTPLYQDPFLESVCACVLCNLGIPTAHCYGWLAEWCEPQTKRSIEVLDAWLNLLNHMNNSKNIKKKEISRFVSRSNYHKITAISSSVDIGEIDYITKRTPSRPPNCSTF